MKTEGCPFTSQKLALTCFIFTAAKYKSIAKFLDNESSGQASFSVADSKNLDCLEIMESPLQLKVKNSKCVSCLFCVFGCPGHKFKVTDSLELLTECNDSIDSSDWGPFFNLNEKVFRGKLIREDELQNASFFNPLGRYQSFEDFTGIDETKNISIWLANTLKFLLGQNSRVGLEIPISTKGTERDGRLDVVGIDKNLFISCEAKISFADLIVDKRFIDQMNSYDVTIRNECKQRGIDFKQYLVIGGNESDLLPPGNPESSTFFEKDLLNFYKQLKLHNITFISAKSLLMLGVRRLISPKDFDFQREISGLIKETDLGLLTSGAVSL
jgi:hypothetical protein